MIPTRAARRRRLRRKPLLTYDNTLNYLRRHMGTTTRSTSLAVLLPAPMAATASPPSSSTPTPTAPQTSHGLLRSACADSAQYHMLLCHYKQISKLADKQRPRALLQALGEHLPRGEWPVGQPHWHRRRRHQEGLHDQGALPSLVPSLRHQPAKGDGEGWESGHPNLRRACITLELRWAKVPTGEQRLLPMPPGAHLNLGATK